MGHIQTKSYDVEQIINVIKDGQILRPDLAKILCHFYDYKRRDTDYTNIKLSFTQGNGYAECRVNNTMSYNFSTNFTAIRNDMIDLQWVNDNNYATSKYLLDYLEIIYVYGSISRSIAGDVGGNLSFWRADSGYYANTGENSLTTSLSVNTSVVSAGTNSILSNIAVYDNYQARAVTATSNYTIRVRNLRLKLNK